MTTQELIRTIGKTGLLQIPNTDVRVSVLIEDAKIAYGCTRYYVSPVSGTGGAWVDSNRVQISKETQS